MKQFSTFVVKALVCGFLLAMPVYLALLLMLRAMKSLAGLVRPLTRVFHAQALPSDAAATALAVVVMVIVCFVLGVALLTGPGQAIGRRIEESVLTKIPGYTLVRSLTEQLAGQGREHAWKPALAEIENGLVPAFIIEETEDGHYTVFVPGAPSPVVGSVYIFSRDRVHPVSASFAQTFLAVTRWGSGAKDLLAAMEPTPSAERTKAA